MFVFFLKKANIALNRLYLTHINEVFGFFPAFYRVLFDVKIKSIFKFS